MTITLKPTASETTIQNNGSDIFTVDSTGIAMAAGKTIQNASGDVVTNTPAFGAQRATTQTLSEATPTKIKFDTKEFDTDSAFDTSTYRFTVPSGKAGLYNFNFLIRIDTGTNTILARTIFYLYKNGAITKRAYNYYTANYIRANSVFLSAILDLAAGDYIEGYAYVDTSDNSGGTLDGNTYNQFSGHKLIT